MRFPRSLSPDRIVLDTVVGDQFSGYEWRVVLEAGRRVYLVAFVIPPDPVTLRLPIWTDNEQAVRAGRSQVRYCEPAERTVRCGRPANGLIRLVDGRLELVIAESSWFVGVSGVTPARVHLAVRRGGRELWETSLVPVPDPP